MKTATVRPVDDLAAFLTARADEPYSAARRAVIAEHKARETAATTPDQPRETAPQP